MSAAWLGYIAGVFTASILLPVLLLIVFRLTPLKRRPRIAYGIAGALAALMPFGSVRAGGDRPAAAIAAVLAAGFFWLAYRRAAKKLAALPAATTPQ
jgi:hypothetical protein